MAMTTPRALATLIETQKRANNLSDDKIVERARARGQKLGKSNLSRVRAQDNPSITKATIFGLAAGLGVTPRTVAVAVLTDMGIAINESSNDDAEFAIRADPSLSDFHRRTLLRMLTGFREEFENAVQDARDKLAGPTGLRVGSYDDEVSVEAKGRAVTELFGNSDPPPPLEDEQLAAYKPKLGEKGSREAREQDELADRPDPEGPEAGA
jgi:hypothetical protein